MAANDLRQHNKYGFQDLAIEESMYVPGDPSNIRSAAAMWGTRYGIWLSTRKADGKGLHVTRIADPPRQPKRKREDKTDRQLLKEIHDTLRCLAVIICRMETTLNELRDDRA